eukprot:gene33046-38168_t
MGPKPIWQKGGGGPCGDEWSEGGGVKGVEVWGGDAALLGGSAACTTFSVIGGHMDRGRAPAVVACPGPCAEAPTARPGTGNHGRAAPLGAIAVSSTTHTCVVEQRRELHHTHQRRELVVVPNAEQ